MTYSQAATSNGATSGMPRALYFQLPLAGDLNPVRELQEAEIVNRLSRHFEVTVGPAEGDYSKLLDLHTPDIVVFEQKAVPHHPLRLKNLKDSRGVPRVMLIRSDPMCYSRPVVLKQIDDLNLEACFAQDSLYQYYLEDIRDRLFFWPHSINPEMFHDYGEPKRSMISFFGHFLVSRPWRIEAARALKTAFPTTFYPHDTSRTNRENTRMMFGEGYARALNASRYVPVEGGFHNALTRKFFEAPGSAACLVAPAFPEIAAYGFRDLENCIIGSPGELVDKIEYVESTPGLYETVVKAGYDLVRQNHLEANRGQILAWLKAYNAKKPGERITQAGALADPVAVPIDDAPPSYLRDRPIDHYFLKRADEDIRQRNLSQAETDVLACFNLFQGRYFAEPKFLLAMIRLLQGAVDEAVFQLVSVHVPQLLPKGVETLDARQAFLLAIAFLARGEGENARLTIERHKALSHPDLDWLRNTYFRDLAPRRGRRQPSRTLFHYAQFADDEDRRRFLEDVARAAPDGLLLEMTGLARAVAE
jgi:hypothetical protein